MRPSESEEEENSESEEEDEDADEVSSDDLDDNVAYLEWYNRAKEDTQEMRAEKYEQFISDGMEDERARIRAHDEKIVWAIKSKFFDTCSRFLEETVLLKGDETHQDILLDIEDKTEKGIDAFKAVKRVLPKHKQKFESLFQYKEDEDESVEDTPDEPPMKRMRPFPH